jgi:hypothetical protein
MAGMVRCVVYDQQVRAAFRRLAQAGPELVAGELAEAGRRILKTAHPMVPLDTGALRDDARLQHRRSKTGIEFTAGYGFGGTKNYRTGTPVSQYVVRQHEDMTLNHPRAGEAKFLEKAFIAHVDGIPIRIKMRILTAAGVLK